VNKSQLVAVLAISLAGGAVFSIGPSDAAPTNAPPHGANMFKKILPALKRTGVPPLLPTLPSLRRYSASIITSSPGAYDIFLGYVPNCQGDACEYGDLIGKKLHTGAAPLRGKHVTLAGGAHGYYLDFTCGASCGESTITVDRHGYRYIFGIKAGKLNEVKALTNSALRAGPHK
jgi:hypothetical protein